MIRALLLGAALTGGGMLAISACTAQAPAKGTPEAQVGLRRNRAYDGAPPVVPHAISALGRQDCLNCHKAGDAVQGDGEQAARTPHPELTNCVQCHVEKRSDDEFRPNSFEGGVWRIGDRQHADAPWLIPHPLTMRENCVVCHTSESMHVATRTTHPERTNCVQCHIPAHEGWPGPRPQPLHSKR